MTASSGNFSFLTSKLPRLQPTTCVWRIFWTAGEKLSLTLKYVNFKFRCKRSHLEIREGKHSQSTLVGKYCKDNPPPKTINLSNSSLWLKFHYGYKYYVPDSDPVGFIAEYTGKLISLCCFYDIMGIMALSAFICNILHQFLNQARELAVIIRKAPRSLGTNI